MVDVTISGRDYTNLSIDTDDDMDFDRASKVAQGFMERAIGDTIADGPQPEWVQNEPMFDEPDWTVGELEQRVEAEIEKYCKPDARVQ